MDSTRTAILGPEWAARTARRRSHAALAFALGVLGVVGILGGAGLRFLQSDVRAQSGTRILIVQAPDTAKKGETFSFTVTAQVDGQVDSAYLGTVAFTSPDDPGATLPTDYTFTTTDAGAHTFDLAASFSTEGMHTLVVTDTADQLISGESSVQVSATGSNPGTGDAPMITEPADGSQINQTSITIRGTAAANATVQITDNNAPLGSTIADTEGNFSYTTPELTANQGHSFVAIVNDAVSTPVTVTINTGVAQAPDLLINPTTVTVTPGQTAPRIDASVVAQENVQIRLQVDQRTVDLQPDLADPTLYKESFVAPETPGAYPIDVIVTDVLGTPQTFTALQTLTVIAGDAPLPTPTPNTAPSARFSFTPTSGPLPLAVRFTAQGTDPEDGTNVTYRWDFGDGTTSTEQNPTHVYKTKGPYTPRLTVRDTKGAEGTAAATSTITPTGPALVAGLLAVSMLLAFALQRRALRHA